MVLDSKSALFTMAVVATASLASVVLLILYAVPIFSATFENFGAEIPIRTQLVISTHKYWIAFPLIPLTVAIKVYRNKSITKSFSRYAGWISIAAFIFACLLIAFTLSAMYAPIFSIEAIPNLK